MRIGLSGVPSTGKTTLAAELSHMLGIPALLEEENDAVFTRCKEISTRNPNEFTPHDKVLFEMTHQRIQIERELSTKEFVTDKPLTVSLMMWLFMCSPYVAPDVLSYQYNKVKAHIEKTYDLLFYLSLGRIPVDRGHPLHRISNPLLLMSMDGVLRAVHSDLHTPAIYCVDRNTSGNEEIAQSICQIIENTSLKNFGR
jgi:hypothetical protein